jgi:predicted DNA-binding transcriptional regulator YafY
MADSQDRAARAHLIDRLRAALTSGRPKSYEELAVEAKCTTRTVRNYLDDAEGTLGMKVERSRGEGGLIRVRAAAEEPSKIGDLASILAREMLKGLFPIAGTSIDERKRAGVQVVVAARGVYEYDDTALKALRSYLIAADKRPRKAVRFYYDGAANGFGPRIIWPLGIVVRDLARVYLAGVPEDATRTNDVRTYNLERVDTTREHAIEVLAAADAGAPPPWIEDAVIEGSIDLPFSMFPARKETGVEVRVRFAKEQIKHVVGRRWHKHQKIKRLPDGGIELTFGPADPGESAAWVRQWGSSVTVLGDEKLLKALG